MSVLAILSLIVTLLKVVQELHDWLAQHPKVTQAVRARMSEVRAQTAQIQATVEDLRESHARVESP